MLDAKNLIHSFNHNNMFLTYIKTIVKCIKKCTRVLIPKLFKIFMHWKTPLRVTHASRVAASTKWTGKSHARSLQVFIPLGRWINIFTRWWHLILGWLMFLKPFRAFSILPSTITQSLIPWYPIIHKWIGNTLAIYVEAYTFIIHCGKKIHI